MNVTMPPIILWIGRFHSRDGYGTAARLHVAALRMIGAPVIAVDVETQAVVGPVDAALIHTDSVGGVFRIRAVDPARRFCAIVHERPDNYGCVDAVGNVQLVGMSYWETLDLPPNWAGWMTSMDQIWAGSEFNRNGFVGSGVPDWMVHEVGHPVDQALLDASPSQTTIRKRWPEETVFLSVVSSVSGRRDISLLYESFSTAFSADDDVALVLKVPEGAEATIRATLGSVMASLPARRSGTWPSVYVIPEDLSREQLIRLHASVDCYVSCERGDGGDLPAMDSLILGVPVVATDFGASGSFLDADDCFLVKTGSKMVSCDSNMTSRHPLYSGHYWPYVDPEVLAEQLRCVHSDPIERIQMGQQASERLRKRYEASSIAEGIVDLVGTLTSSGVRSNLPAVVRVSPKSRSLSRADALTTMVDSPAVHEARLLVQLADAQIAGLRDPKSFAIGLKSATNHAAQHREQLKGTPTREALSGVMVVPMRSPVSKARSIRRMLAQLPALLGRFGDLAGARQVVNVADDYLGALDGASSKFSPEELEVDRRAVWGRHGPFLSPPADRKRLESLRDLHRGERVFIMGNGPSLAKCDLSRLAAEHTFGVNKIHLLFDQIDWRPTYYTLLDWKMGPAVAPDVDQYADSIKFFPERFRGLLPGGAETYWYAPRKVGKHIDDQFDPNITEGIPSSGTVLMTAIQQAFFLGFRDIILIGVDAAYSIPASVRQEGPDINRTGTKLHLTSTANDDPNHFDPAYFGAGDRWHDPNVDEMRRMFKLMRKGVTRHGGTLRNATIGGELDELDRVDYDSLFDR